MEQKNIENIDIEKCKELFGYEMTQVVLMLKGEFATVSGKDLGYAQHHVTQQERNAPLAAISQANIPPVQTEAVNVPQVLAEKCAAPLEVIRQTKQTTQTDGFCVTVNKPNMELPHMDPEAYTCAIPAAEPVRCDVQIPQVSAVTVQPIPAAAYTLPKVAVPAVAAAPQVNIPREAAICSQVEIPNVPHICVNMPVVGQTTVCVDVPKVQKIAPVVHTAVTVTPVSAQVAVPEIPTVSIQPVTVQTGNIQIPKVSKITMPRPVKSAAASDVPTVPVMVPVKQVPVVPAMPTIAVANPQITVPELPRYHVLSEIQPAPMQKLSDIPVPPRPDFQTEQQEILLALAREI